jgi:uncharacterized protein (DUF885 family)
MRRSERRACIFNQEEAFMRFGVALLCIVALITATVRAEDAAITKRFHALLDAEWEYTLREEPTFASHLGDKRYNDRWPDVSLAAVARRHEHKKDLLGQLDKIDSSQLSALDRLNYQLFRKELTQNIELMPFRPQLMAINQRGGIQTENETADELVFSTVKDYEDWIARLRDFPVYTDQTIELLRAGVKARLVQPKIVMRRLPDQIRKQIVEEPSKSPFYKPFEEFTAEIGTANKERLRSEAASAIRDHVVPAYRKLAKFFDDEYYPACFDEVGAWQLPRGDEYYAIRARHFTTTSMTPEEIHAIGLKEVTRIRGEMETIVKQVEFKGSSFST